MINFNGRVLFLTGAAGGIGRAIAQCFYHCGARLFLTDTHASGLQVLVQDLGGAADRVATATLDVADSGQVDAAFALCKERFGGVDYLVPGAGIFQNEAKVAELSDEAWRRTMTINLDGVFYTCRAAIPLLRDGGAVVNIASVAGHRGSPGYAHYSATKGAVLTFTRALAAELAPRVRANAVSPGLIDTAMITSHLARRGEALLKATALQRVGRPEEVANTIAFLCSDLASYITGETIHINGGLYIAS